MAANLNFENIKNDDQNGSLNNSPLTFSKPTIEIPVSDAVAVPEQVKKPAEVSSDQLKNSAETSFSQEAVNGTKTQTKLPTQDKIPSGGYTPQPQINPLYFVEAGTRVYVSPGASNYVAGSPVFIEPKTTIFEKSTNNKINFDLPPNTVIDIVIGTPILLPGDIQATDSKSGLPAVVTANIFAFEMPSNQQMQAPNVNYYSTTPNTQHNYHGHGHHHHLGHHGSYKHNHHNGSFNNHTSHKNVQQNNNCCEDLICYAYKAVKSCLSFCYEGIKNCPDASKECCTTVGNCCSSGLNCLNNCCTSAIQNAPDCRVGDLNDCCKCCCALCECIGNVLDICSPRR